MACEKVTSKTSVVEVFTKKLEAELHNKRLEHNMVSQLNISAESKKTQCQLWTRRLVKLPKRLSVLRNVLNVRIPVQFATTKSRMKL